MTPEELQKSVVLITSSDSQINKFGTGFIIHQASGAASILTCAHVVKDIGGTEKVKVEGISATVIASGADDGLDLAVLRVDGLGDKPRLKLKASGERDDSFITAGFQVFDKAHLIRSLRGTLGEQVGLQSIRLGERIQAWDLCINDSYSLQPGYSGSPVIDEVSGNVIGVISHRRGADKGLAISIEALEKIWKCIDSEELYRNLLKLGYRQQVRLFRKLVKENSIAALLIHGLPDYGQRWLLNLLLVKHLPYITTSKIVKIGLNRRTRRSNARAIWRELCSYFSLPKHSSPSEISERVYQNLQTQNIILIFHNVEWIPRESLVELVQDFWLPLANKVQKANSFQNNSRLFMFLLDYDGYVGSLKDMFADTLNSIEQSFSPIKAPKINEFSEQELNNWIVYETDELPTEIMEEIEEQVQEIIDSSEGGIPELTLDEICERCGCNWYEESEKWLVY